jgi:hypothetical protein
MIDIVCPDCEGHAKFVGVSTAVLSKSQRPYFQTSKSFDLERVFWNGWKTYAVYFHGLGNRLDSFTDMPEGISHEHFYTSPYGFQNSPNMSTPSFIKLGTVECLDCGLRRRHSLEWPRDAWFSVTYKNVILWSYNREQTLKLLNYIASDERKKCIPYNVSGLSYRSAYKQDYFLRRIPTVFQTAKARLHIVKKLKTLLGGS